MREYVSTGIINERKEVGRRRKDVVTWSPGLKLVNIPRHHDVI
jgi:hypothetical protein